MNFSVKYRSSVVANYAERGQKFLLAIGIVFFNSHNSFCQFNNLVPNPSFENINFEKWNDFYNSYQHCEHWFSPNDATPDINYELIKLITTNKPLDNSLFWNINQNVCARTGLSFGGLVLNAIRPKFNDTLNNKYSEYLQVKLKNKL
jgi:hypothetical protein